MINGTLKFLSRLRIKYLSKLEPVECQRKILSKILSEGRVCKFYTDHSLSFKMNPEDYQSQVPLRTYEDFWNEYISSNFPVVTNCIWPGTIRNYSWTSGTTTGTRKYIPYNSNIRLNYTLAGIDMLAFHYFNRPDSTLFSGKILALTASENFEEPEPGIFIGEVSGFSTKNIPFFLQYFKYPPSEIARIKNWQERVEQITKDIPRERITGLGGMPSWLIVFLERLGLNEENQKGFLRENFPNLKLLIHGGVNFLPYYERFKDMCHGMDVDFREIYPASEGFIAVADRGFGDGLRLLFNHGIFFEFVPVEEIYSKNPTRHWIKNVELDVNYGVVITNGAGLWSYILGDTIKFISLKPPRILITGRTKLSLSAFGEHLIGEEIEKAVQESAKQLNTYVVDFCVAPQFVNKKNCIGRHHYLIETTKNVDPDEFANLIDSHLQTLNDDYRDHRQKDCGIDIPLVTIVPSGFFVNWMKSRERLGDQFKVPRVLNNELYDNILEFLKRCLE